MMRWSGTLLQIVGALLVASNTINPYWGYAVMLPGAVIWLVLGLLNRDFALALMQGVFAAINLIGIGRWAA